MAAPAINSVVCIGVSSSKTAGVAAILECGWAEQTMNEAKNKKSAPVNFIFGDSW